MVRNGLSGSHVENDCADRRIRGREGGKEGEGRRREGRREGVPLAVLL